jgi:hypothetical protein
MADYWMRWVDFATLRDLLALIIESPGKFTPSGLDRAATDSGSFLLGSGKPRGPTSRYHHRRALEKLDMVVKRDGRYAPNLEQRDHDRFMVDRCKGRLTFDQRHLFGDRVIQNEDCYRILWNVFTPSPRPKSVQEFTQMGEPISLCLATTVDAEAKLERGVVLRPLGKSNPAVSHWGYKSVQAIHFGMRTWGTSQLRFLDQLFRVGEGYVLLPVNVAHQHGPGSVSLAIADSLEFVKEWASPKVSDIMISVASRLKIPLSEIGTILKSWTGLYPGYISPIPVSQRMILSDQPSQIHESILKGFLTLDSGEYASHLRVHISLLGMIGITPQDNSNKV